MKIAITGHSDGIGQAIYQRLMSRFPLQGYSRANGFDIANQHERSSLLQLSDDCDILINNAWSTEKPLAQLELAKEWYGLNQNQHRFLINIGSFMTAVYDAKETYPQLHDELLELRPVERFYDYMTCKKELEIFTVQINSANTICRATNIRPAVVDTKMVPFNIRALFEQLIQSQQIAQVVEQVVDNWTQGILISTVDIENTKYK